MKAHAAQRWEELRQRLDSAARESKNPQAVVVELSRRYGDLSPNDRVVVDELIADWVLAEDEAKRFDALALIAEHRIRTAAAAVRELCRRLETSDEPSAPYEWAKANRVLGRVTEAGGPLE